ncbi:pyridoxamine 5'-phosphate oxidase family protein [Candidatus Deferrimicrobium sp.]|uniref:pyridoxamine 5'-phosphate oxidase family protein n=1 Tax=Candidatus Deferrimicrobium sp. TaxID=3060586 RepID=UPI003C6559C3
MRRADKEIADREEIDKILRKATVCRLGLLDGTIPYIVPLSFGYEGNTLYFHSAHEGKKVDLLKRNAVVCFEVDVDAEPVRSETACGWTMRYRSVIGSGTASFVEDHGGKSAAMQIIMRQYTDGLYEFPEEMLRKIDVIKVAIREISGKVSGFPGKG